MYYSDSRKGHLVLKDYLGGDNGDKNVLHQREQSLNFPLDTWLRNVNQL